MKLFVRIITFVIAALATCHYFMEPLAVLVDNSKALTPGGPPVKYLMVAFMSGVLLIWVTWVLSDILINLFRLVFFGGRKNRRVSNARIVFKHHGLAAAMREVVHSWFPAKVSGFSLTERKTSVP
jgi:hypothetical protein